MGAHEAPIDCPDHRPTQHRDAKPPWCRRCGLDATGRTPVQRLGLPTSMPDGKPRPQL